MGLALGAVVGVHAQVPGEASPQVRSQLTFAKGSQLSRMDTYSPPSSKRASRIGAIAACRGKTTAGCSDDDAVDAKLLAAEHAITAKLLAAKEAIAAWMSW